MLATESKALTFAVGPCSLHSPSQAENVVKFAASEGVDTRWGLVKPRTKPGGYLGPGVTQGLEIIGEAIDKHPGPSIHIEIWDKAHIQEVVEFVKANPHMIINLWIGARTGPGNIIGERAKEVNELLPPHTILDIKNPIHKSYADTAGRIEWALTGLPAHRIRATMRGFGPGSNGTKNPEDLSMAVQLQDEFGVEIDIDPSHIAGNSPENVIATTARIVERSNDLSTARNRQLVRSFKIEATDIPCEMQTDRDQALSLTQAAFIIGYIRSHMAVEAKG